MKALSNYPFQANPGVLFETPENLQPTFFFEVFLNDEVIEFFVAETNSYAEKVCQNMAIKVWECSFKKWKFKKNLFAGSQCCYSTMMKGKLVFFG